MESMAAVNQNLCIALPAGNAKLSTPSSASRQTTLSGFANPRNSYIFISSISNYTAPTPAVPIAPVSVPEPTPTIYVCTFIALFFC